MKKRFRHIAMLALTALTTVVLTGCNHKDLYVENFDKYQVRVDFNYDQTSEVPATMRVVFYPIGELSWHKPWRFDVRSTGGLVQLPAGDYRVLAYNVDARNVLELDFEEFDNFLLTTDSYDVTVVNDNDNNGNRAPRRQLFGGNVPIGEGEKPDFPLYAAPDWTCTCRTDFFHVEPLYETIGIYKKGEEQTHEISDKVQASLTLDAVDAVKRLEFVLTGIEGVQWATLLRGTISGIPVAHNMATGEPSNDLGMMTFAAHVDEEQQAVVGSMNVWGFFPPDNPNAHQFLNVYVWANNGNHYVAQDVTIQMETGQETNTGRVILNLHTSGMNLIDAGNGNSGFKPSVGSWDEQNANIKL